MSKHNLFQMLEAEVARIDLAKTAKRHERVIEGFTSDRSPKAIIEGKPVMMFNSNDYLGLRFHPKLKKAEHDATGMFGTGPGAVRFISGSLKPHRDLEIGLAHFHGRDDAMVFSSAFAANLSVLFCLLKGQSKDSVLTGNVLVISDELNHRSIIDGIRLANLSSEQKAIFKHMDSDDLEHVLLNAEGKFDRVLVVTDGVFSMLGEYQQLKKMKEVIERFDTRFRNGVLLVVDDCHGVGIVGKSGRGVEEVEEVQADVLVGTLGKALGADGGYVVANQTIINYLRESAATYIYSNSISPGTAAAALAAIELLDDSEGKNLLDQSAQNVQLFQQLMIEAGFRFAAESTHAIQPVLVGDPTKTKQLSTLLLEKGFLVTSINYPVVPKGRDEIRIQISALHTHEDIQEFVRIASGVAKEIGIIAR